MAYSLVLSQAVVDLRQPGRVTWHLKAVVDLIFDALPDLVAGHVRIFQ